MAELVNARCLACGEAHDFGVQGDEPAEVGESYVYICPATSRPARLRLNVAARFVRRLPPGAVMISRVEPGMAVLNPWLLMPQAGGADLSPSAV